MGGVRTFKGLSETGLILEMECGMDPHGGRQFMQLADGLMIKLIGKWPMYLEASLLGQSSMLMSLVDDHAFCFIR